jgi:uncharacterized cupredoxin-like copper-binding protein
MPDHDRQLRRRATRALIVGGAFFASAAILTSCSNEASGLGEDATEVQVSLGRFVIEPAALEVPEGDLVLRVTNDDPDLAHDLVAYGKGTRRLAPGESQTLEIPAVAAGQYRMWCDVPGHAAAGQTGTLVVTPVTDADQTSA